MKDRLNRLRQKGAQCGVTKQNVALVWMVAIVSLSLVSGVTAAQVAVFDFVEAHGEVGESGTESTSLDYHNGQFYVTDASDEEIDFYDDSGGSWSLTGTMDTADGSRGFLYDVAVYNGTIYVLDDTALVSTFDVDTQSNIGFYNVPDGIHGIARTDTGWIGAYPSNESVVVFDNQFNVQTSHTVGFPIRDLYSPSGASNYYATDGGNNTIYTVDPSDWSLERSSDVESDGYTAFKGITHNGDRLYIANSESSATADNAILEYETSTEQEPTSANLTLKHDRYMEFGSTQDYTVIYENETGRHNVTTEANVTSSNTSVVAFNQNYTMTATSDENVSVRVTTTANYTPPNGTTITDTNYVAVAKPDVENLEVLPPIWRFSASFGSPTIQAILVAVLMGVFAGRVAGAFAGLGMMELVMVAGWFIGYVSVGMAMISLFVALFIGLNMAANIDYQVTR